MELASIRWNIPLRQSSLACQGAGHLDSHPLILAFPFSWMNQSGPVVADLLATFEIVAEKLVVVHDDLDLTFGTLRFKSQGGAGGHNGIHSLIASLETDRFHRLKLGIGRPSSGEDPAQYVLSPFHLDESSKMESVLSQAVDALEVFILEGRSAAMNRFHTRNEEK